MSLLYVDAIFEERNLQNIYCNCQKTTYDHKFQQGLTKIDEYFDKTGTTICGLTTQNSVIIASDTRASSGSTVADKNCQKIRYLAKNIFCAGAGLAADIKHIPYMVQAKLELLRLSLRASEVRVAAAVSILQQHLCKYNGALKSYLIVGGVDCTGSHLYKVYAHGSVEKAPFCSLGSGSLNALGQLELYYNDNLTHDEGLNLIKNAIRAGIVNDLGSGSNIDVAVIKRSGQDFFRGTEKINTRRAQLIPNKNLEKIEILYENIEFFKLNDNSFDHDMA